MHILSLLFFNTFLSPVFLPVFNLDALGTASLYILEVVLMFDGTKEKDCLCLESVAWILNCKELENVKLPMWEKDSLSPVYSSAHFQHENGWQ